MGWRWLHLHRHHLNHLRKCLFSQHFRPVSGNRKVCNSGNRNRQLEPFKDHYLMVKRANLRILDVLESCPQRGVGGEKRGASLRV